jgi:hypothetical protein
MEAHQIIANIHIKFPQLCRRASKITGKSEEFYRSHHRESKSRNPEATGNCSPLTHFLEFCHLYEAASPGAGQCLIDLLHAALTAEFAGGEPVTIADIHKETSEAVQSHLEAKPRCVQAQETVEAIGALGRHLRVLTREILPPEIKAKARSMNGNGRARG